MWTRLSHKIIKYRLLLVIFLAIITAFMAYKAREIELSYDFAKAVPADDPEMIYFQQFKELFGEDGNLVAIGIQDSSIYEPQNFRRFKYLSEEIASLKGINDVVSFPLLKRLKKDTSNRSFYLQDIFTEIPDRRDQLDSLYQVALNEKFYSGQIINEKNGAMLMLASINKDFLNSEKRQELIKDVQFAGESFTRVTGLELHYAGLPFVRSVITGKVKQEMGMFIFFSVLITSFIMLLFFRTWHAVVFPMVIIGVVVMWVLGTIVLFNYKITLLIGLIPSIIVVIGIPNSIYLLNKYHHEFERHGNKMMAVSRVVRKIGFVTLLTNFTTAIGFLVLISTDITILTEFGIIAGINIMATFLVSIILIPSVFSWMPAPSQRELKHLKFRHLARLLHGLDLLVHRHKYLVFLVTGVIILFSMLGLYRVYSISYIVDDIPEKSKIKQDLKFFEQNFSGVMPLEVIVDTGKKRGVLRLDNLLLIQQFEDFLESQEAISRPVSIISFIKAVRQAYYNNHPDFYDLPTRGDQAFIFRYLREQNDSSGLVRSFMDSTSQKMRISLKIADIGSIKMDSLINQVIIPKKEQLFADSGMDVNITGTTPLFVKGNKFLIENLQYSFLLAFVIIAFLMALLFVNLRMIIISLVPNVIPLMMTGAIMGYFGIPLKPSTVIIFSISFGISVDYSIHFLAKYRQELFANRFFVPVAVSNSLKETGKSMIYTSAVLFAGFVIFTASGFGGTVALGFLTSTTLFIAMLTNLIVLPSLILAFDTGKRKKGSHTLIEHHEGFYAEDEDEEIDLGKIQVTENEVEKNAIDQS